MLYSDEYKPQNYRYIGKINAPRKDARDIVTGKATFLDDFTLPRTLIGKSLKSPYAHALIEEIDVEKARKLKGVAAVITYKEADQNWKLGWPPVKPIVSRKMRYVGDTVALVAAETAEIAKAALDLIEVRYELLPDVIDGISAAKDGAPRLYEEFERNIVTPGYPPFQKDGPFWQLFKGDVETGFEECAFVADDTVEFAKMAAPMAPEPLGALVRWDGGDDYTVWVTSQSSYVCKILNSSVIPNCNLDIQTFNVGGSYGNKQTMVVQVVSAAMLARVTGRPVKFYQTKTEQLTSFETRLGSQVHAKIGMDKDGVVKAVDADWFVDTGAFCNATQGQIGVWIGETQLVMAKCPNWRLDTNCVVTNKQPAGIVRGYGGQELNSCLALLMGRTMRAGNFALETTVGKNISPAEIEKKFDSVYYATGAWKRPILGLAGEELTVFGLDFLVEANEWMKGKIGGEVLVTGGGNVAIDVAITAKRLGASHVTLACLEPLDAMPAGKEEIARAREEGVEIMPSWGLDRALEENGAVKGMRLKRCVSVFDGRGSFNPQYDENEKTTVYAENILMAVGQKADLSFLDEKYQMQLNRRGLIDV
jgi:hypothetical protein